MTDIEIVRKSAREQDVIVHIAAHVNVDESYAEPASFLAVNLTGTYNILEAVRETGVRMIYSSSWEVYGSGQPGRLSEISELRPHSPYAASEAAADRLCFAYFNSYGVNVTIVRPSNVYGERQKSGKVVPLFPSSSSAPWQTSP